MVDRSGSQLVIESLMSEHGGALLRWSRDRFDDPRDAEEVVADTLVRAWRGYGQFDPERGAERAWLLGIAKNAAADHYRKGKRHLRSVPVPQVQESAEFDTDLDRLVENSQILDALNSLTDRHRLVVIDAYFGGLTANQISEHQGVPPGTVKSRLYYALRAMRGYLEEEGVIQ